MKRYAWIALLLITTSACLADDDKPVMQDIWKDVLHKASQGASAIKNYGKPRMILKGAKPEILIKGDQILIDGKPVAIGQPIDMWKKVLPKKPRCNSDVVRTVCRWDALGVEVATETAINTSVMGFTIYFNLEPREPLLVTKWPDGTPAVDYKDQRPKHPFRGYFAIDGYGVDGNTEFWEILAKANPQRNLHCGVRDCGFPLGALNAKDTLDFRLNKPNVHGNIYELSVSGP